MRHGNGLSAGGIRAGAATNFDGDEGGGLVPSDGNIPPWIYFRLPDTGLSCLIFRGIRKTRRREPAPGRTRR
jgi:hypothetical protein